MAKFSSTIVDQASGIAVLDSTRHIAIERIPQTIIDQLADHEGRLDALEGKGFVHETITLQSTDIDNKGFTLTNTPYTPGLTMLVPEGGLTATQGTDYSISGNTVSWDGLGLDGLMAAGEVIQVWYDFSTGGIAGDLAQEIADRQAGDSALSGRITTIENDYGVSNGLATLDSSGKIPSAQLPNAIMEYQGTWNANTNTPTLADGAGNADPDIGNVWRVSVAGTQNLGSGNQTFGIGDYVVLNSSKIWEKSDTTDAVASVNGYTGVVDLDLADFPDVQTALSGKSDTSHTHDALVAMTSVTTPILKAFNTNGMKLQSSTGAEVGSWTDNGNFIVGPATGLTVAHKIQNSNSTGFVLSIENNSTGAEAAGLDIVTGINSNATTNALRVRRGSTELLQVMGNGKVILGSASMTGSDAIIVANGNGLVLGGIIQQDYSNSHFVVGSRFFNILSSKSDGTGDLLSGLYFDGVMKLAIDGTAGTCLHMSPGTSDTTTVFDFRRYSTGTYSGVSDTEATSYNLGSIRAGGQWVLGGAGMTLPHLSLSSIKFSSSTQGISQAASIRIGANAYADNNGTSKSLNTNGYSIIELAAADTVTETTVVYKVLSNKTAQSGSDNALVTTDERTLMSITQLGKFEIGTSGGSNMHNANGYCRIVSPTQSSTTLVNGQTYQPDCSTKHIFYYAAPTSAGATVTMQITNLAEGQTVSLLVASSGQAYTITWNTPSINWNVLGTPTPTSTASRYDLYTFIKIGGLVFGSAVLNMKV
jgi:hypothetical protein